MTRMTEEVLSCYRKIAESIKPEGSIKMKSVDFIELVTEIRTLKAEKEAAIDELQGRITHTSLGGYTRGLSRDEIIARIRERAERTDK